VIFLTGEALEIVKRLAEKHPTGPLFRTNIGSTWNRQRIVEAFRVIRLKLGMKHDGLTAYTYRHTFATNWLASGRSIEILAELLGNSPAVLRKHYSHLLSDPAKLRGHLEGFVNA
jgi:integrase